MAENDIKYEGETPAPGSDGQCEVWDEEYPFSMMAMLHPRTRAMAKKGRDQMPELYAMDETELFVHLSKLHRSPTPTMNRLRNHLWMVFDKARTRGHTSISVKEIIAGNVTEMGWEGMVKNPYKGSWLFTPPQQYTQMIDEALQYGLLKLRTILAMPEEDANGKLNMKLLEMKLKITMMMDMRKNGAPTQKIEQKSMNYNVTSIESDIGGQSLVQLEMRAMELRKQNLLAQNLAPQVVAELMAAPPRASHRDE